MKVAIAQINTTVGDLDGNTKKIINFIKKSKKLGAKLVVFPEMAITGYPPLDLLHRNGFVAKNKAKLEEIKKYTSGITAVVGFVDINPNKKTADSDIVLYNSAAIIKDKNILGVQYKTLLPTYDVFDENRYFEPATNHKVFDIGLNLAVTICEDIWDETYEKKVVNILAKQKPGIIVNISASPFYYGKQKVREAVVGRHVRETGAAFVYVNQVGGQDELVFDGGSFAFNSSGLMIASAKRFQEDFIVYDTESNKSVDDKVKSKHEEYLEAITLGLKDYFTKTGFKKSIIGLSGGIDSALTAAIAVKALGKENVTGISMPSAISSKGSKDDAKKLAKNLGIKYLIFPISESVDLSKKRFSQVFGNYKNPVTIENIQARERGKILMEISNDTDALVLSTGNKTELALGYCTLYGDMAGGLAVISDLNKIEVYEIAKFINSRAGKQIIPKSTIEKPPSAELSEKQVDPFDYNVIAPLVDAVVEDRSGEKQLLSAGYKKRDINLVLKAIKLAEYKRRQAAPGIKVTKKAFGIGWRMPIVNKYEG